ncbi:MAG: hypothetical protein ABII12_12195 [Planctomycetota bacterium]
MVLLMTAGVGFAQDEGDQGPAGRPHRDRMGEGKRDRAAGPVKMLTLRLNLDETQQAEFERLFKEHMKQEAEARSSYMPSEELREKMRQIREEVRAAREAGDQEKIDELKAKMRELREEQQASLEPLHEQMAKSKDELHDKLLALLNEDQKDTFEEVWEQRIARRFGHGGPPPRRPQVLKAIVDKLEDLTPAQEEQIQGIFEDCRKAARDAASTEEKPKTDRKADRERTEKLYKDVLAVLTPQQREEVEKKLSREGGPPRDRGMHRRGPGAGRMHRGHGPDGHPDKGESD